MCLIAFAIEAHPATPLLIAGNRDEFFERPTAPLHRWALPNGIEVLAGRDLRDGGTWLGLSAEGRVAMLTNVRSADLRTGARSRGELANHWLAGDVDWDGLLGSLLPTDYGGFNLVVGDALTGDWGWVSNRDPAQPHSAESRTLHSRRLLPGVYGLSNATLDTDWPKTQRLKRAVAEALANGHDDGANGEAGLLQALGETRPAPSDTLPRTGVPDAVEAALSSPFVRIPANGYGTRTSLLVRASRTDSDEPGAGLRVTLNEWTHAPQADASAIWTTAQHQSFSLDW